MAHEIQQVEGELVTFTSTYSCPTWERDEVSWSTLRFLDTAALASFLAGADLVVDRQLGGWDGEPLTPTSDEIITFAEPTVGGRGQVGRAASHLRAAVQPFSNRRS
jgi:hypothetical protein